MLAGNPFHIITTLLDMLEVEGSDDHDSGRQDFFHVLPALGVLAARRVVVGDAIDQTDLRMPAEDGFHIHRRSGADFLERNDFQGLHQMRELGGQVRLNGAHNHILAPGSAPPALI